MSSLRSTDGHYDFSSAQAGRWPISRQSFGLHLTLNWPALCEEYAYPQGAGLSLSRSQGSLYLELGGTINFYSFQYFDCIRLPLINPYWRIEAYFRFLSLPSRLPRNRGFKSNIIFLVRSHSRRGFSMFEPPCLITHQTRISQEASYSFSL